MAGRISIPIEFEVARESAASVIRTLESQLAKLKPGTAIYDSIKKQIADATKLLGKVDKQFSFGYNAERDIARTEKDFISLAAVIDTVNAAFERLDVSALNLNITEGEFGNIATQVKAVNTQLQAALVNFQKLQGTKVKDLFDGRETRKLGQFTAEQKESSGLAVYEKIGQQMEAIGLQAADAETRVQSLERALAALQQTQARKGYTSTSTNTEHASAARIYGLTGTSDEKMGDIRARIMEELQGAFKSDGTKKSTTDAVVTEILTAFEIDESEITAALTAKVSERQERLRQIVYNLDGSAGKGITSDKVKHARSRIHGMAREYAGAAALQQQIQDTSNELAGAQTEKNSFENQLAGLTTAFQSLRTKLQAKKIIGADGTIESSETQAEIDQLRTQVEALSAQLTGQVKSGSGKNIIPPSGDSGRSSLNSLNEADAFKASMQNAVKQWFSVQQIINVVKNGIRQAYQDIQGLDKAMTNIAVVTDMAISDLWSKINEYMSIAQQYGVTTQGVYEVSQLYYQQGLSTNEVMAATTETLKMARIAGMGYVEAADAMTVAIRSFKMEMSDAATVTDVYSKVAAITASDSEELAIAMSKTASSAESVGSSFENTTAMLAVMIETTRESAQNLGSALKSIISRYGEMKVGLTVDSEGEDIDYNKVDTALKSVGISIKDAQGQFRDFDDVIFELSEKWDSLDKNTQRYIATIMAGNRQQSRFIALVDNWERLDEVAGAAHNAEDAGLLQYAKTLDSLETKINNIKTSFQQFYMSIFNGPVIGAILDFINNLIQGLNKLGNWQSILNIAGLIRNIKLIGTLIVNTIAPSMASIVTQFKTAMEEIVQIAKQKGFEAGQEMARGQSNGYNSFPQNVNRPNIGNANDNTGDIASSGGMAKWGDRQKLGKAVSVGGAVAGLVLTSVGTAIAADNARAGSIVSGLGNVASGASMGAMFGPWGAAIGGIIGGLASLPAVFDSFDPAKELEEKLQKAEEVLQEANVEKAETKENYTSMADYIEKIKRLEETRYDSEKNYEEWIKTNEEALDKFPELAAAFDDANNIVVDLTYAEEALTLARLKAADAAKAAADASVIAARERYNTVVNENKTDAEYITGVRLSTGTFGLSISLPEHIETGTPEEIQAYLREQGLYTIGELVGRGPENMGSNYIYYELGDPYDKIIIDDNGNEIGREPVRRITLHSRGNGTGQTGVPGGGLLGAMAAGVFDLSQPGILADIARISDIEDDYEYIAEIIKMVRNHPEYIVGYNPEADVQSEDYLKRRDEWLTSYLTSERVNGGPPGWERLTTWSNVGNVEVIQAQRVLDNTIQTAVGAYVDSLLLGYDQNDSLLALNGAGSVIHSYVFDALERSGEDWETWKAAPDGFIKSFSEIEEELTSLYEDLYSLGKVDDFNNLLLNKDKYSWQEFAGFLEDFGIETGSKVWTALQNDFENSSDRLTKGLSTISFIEDKEIPLAEDLNNWIPKGYIDAFLKEARLLEDYVENGKITLEQADSLFNAYTVLWKTIATSIPEEKRLQAREMLEGADLTSIDGILAFEKQFEETFGIDIDLSTFSNLAHLFSNLNTQIQTAISTVTTISEGIKKLSENQAKGFSLEEANKIFAQLKEIDPSISWNDIFTYNEQGLLVLKDFYDTAEKIYQDQLTNIDDLANNLEEAEEQLTEDNFKTFWKENSKDIDVLKGSGTTEEKAQARNDLIDKLASMGINKDVGAAFVDAIADGTIDSYDAMLEWFDAMGEELGAAAEWLRRETQKTFIGNAFDTRFNKFKTRKSATEYATVSSYDGLRQMVIDLAGDRVNEEGFDPDKWVASFFEDTDIDAYDTNLLEGIELDELGNLIINDPIAYANSLIRALGITDEATIAAIHEAVFGAYNSQWEARTQQVETLLADYKFSTKEMADMFGYLVGVNEIDLNESKYLGKTPAEQMAVWASENGFTFKDGEWHALTREAYDTAVRTIAAQNPDADFSNIPTWKEWLGQQAMDAATQHEKALEFLKEISIDMGPEKLNEAIELGLINANDISEDDWSALAAGDMTVWDVMNKYYHPLEGSDYAEAWAIGQERYRQDAAKELNELFGKAAFKPEELLEIWEYIGNGQDFETWARQAGFEYDAVTQQYYARGEKAFATLTSYGKTRYGQDIDIPSSAAFYGVEQRAMAKELEDKKIAFFKELSPEAGIEELDKAYEQGIITQAQYLEILANAVATEPIEGVVEEPMVKSDFKRLSFGIVGYETPTSIYDSLKTIAKDDPELYQALLEGQASYEKQALTAIEEMFRDGTISADMISQMWSNVADQTTDMITWAGQHGITYENGEWLIKTAEDAAKAYELMASWWAHEYKGTEMASQMPSKAEFVSMMSSTQKVEEDAINEFIKTITPDVSDADLQKAVEVGLLTWKEIASYQKEGKSTYEILIAAALKQGEEGQAALREAQKTYQQDVTEAIESLFTDGFLSSEEIEKIWMNADTVEDMDTWATKAGFQLIDNEWQITSENAYNEMLQWVKDTYGEAYALMVPSYETLVALNPLKEAKNKKASLDFLKELTPDMDESDVLSGVEQGIFTEDQVRWAQDLVNAGASWYEAMYQTIVRENELIEQNFNALASANVDETFLQRLLENGRISAEQYQQIISIAANQKISLKEAMIKVLEDSRSANNAALAAYEESYLNYQAEGIAAVRSMAEKGSWSEADIIKMWQAKSGAVEGFNNWANTNFEWIDNAWYVKTEQGYNDLKAWITEEYGTAAAAMLPSFAELQHLSLFKEKATSKEQLDFLEGLNLDASYADLEKAMELGFFTSEDLNKYLSENGLDINNLNSDNILTIIGNFIKSDDEEALKAFNKAIVDENISRGEAALKLFEDNVLSWEEIAELWAADGATGDIGTWAQEKGLSYIDDEWHITTREGYEAIVEAAKKIYGDAWEAVTPTYEAIMASQQLELDIDKDKQADFFEELASDEEVTAEDVQRALELGIVTEEQIYAAQQGGWSYEKLLQFAMANNAEWRAAYQKGYGEYNETRLKELEEIFGGNDGIFSYEQVYRMWEVLGDGVDFNTWVDEQGLEFDGTSYKANAAQAYALMHGMATEWWGNAAASMIPSEAAMTSLFNIEREIQLDEQLDFMKGLTPEMTMADAQKAVELGIISQDQLLWLEQTYGDSMADYFGFISQQFAAIEGANWEAFQESYEDYQTTRMTEAQTFLGKTSFSLADMTNIWQATRSEGEEFGDWIEDLVFEGDLIFDGENWNVENPERIWPVIKEYIQKVYGFTDEDFDFEYMEQQFLASVHQQIASVKEKKLSFLRGLGETLTLDDLNEALEAGILTESEYDAVITKEGGYDSDDIREAIAGSLETPEEIAAYNEAIEQRNLQRIETITALFEDTALSSNEIFEMYKASGATEDIVLWAQQQGFVLEDGKWYAKTKQAYKAMEEYVIKQFGEAYTYLLPSEEEWLASGLFDDLIERESQISFIKEISPTASASTLKEAAEKFGIEFTQEELLLLEAGVIDYYDILLEKLKTSSNKEWQNWANLIELQNIDAARRSVFEQTEFTTLEDYAAAYQQLADLGFTTHEIEHILADQAIDMEETANMIRVLEARTTGKTDVYLQGEALLAAAKKYNISLADFFERSVLSPTQVLEYLGLTLSNLSVEDYDAYITAQNDFNASIQRLFEGTGTAADMQRLIETANQAAISGYELTTDNFIITAEGIQLDRSQFFTALEILRQTDANAYRAIRESFVADPSLWGEEINSIADVEERLNDLARQRVELGEEITEQNAQQVALLEEQASLYAEIYGTMSMQKSEGWDFLNNELHGNAENFISWSNSVHSAFEQVGSKEGIDPKNFINLLNYMQQMGVQVQTLGTNFNSWADLMQAAYSTFGKAMVTGSKVATTDIGVSAENMSTGMLDAVHAMAESQIKFLDAQIAMLEGLIALENVEFTGIGDFATQMQAQLDKYNKAMGLTGDAAIKLEDLKISINGIVYPLTQEGLADAEKAWQALGYQGNFLDNLISQILSPEGQKSILSGGVVEMNPTADIKLSTDTQATISEIQTANSILREIAANTDPRLQQRIKDHQNNGGTDLSTQEGAVEYFNNNPEVFEGILGKDDQGLTIVDKAAYEALSAFDKEIFNLWYASQNDGKRFDQSDLYGYWYPSSTEQEGSGRATETHVIDDIEPTYTYYGATKGSYEYVQKDDGSWGYRYAHNTDNGEEYLFLPEDGNQARNILDKQIEDRWGQNPIAMAVLNNMANSTVWKEWYDNLGEADQETAGEVRDWINSDPYLQGLFFMSSGQMNRLPSYGAGVTAGGAGGTKTQPSFNMDDSVSDIQGNVSGIYDNTAETNALLRGFDLRTEEGQRGYYNNYLGPDKTQGIPLTLPKDWDETVLGAKPKGYDDMNNQDKLMAYQNAWLSEVLDWTQTEIDLWHKYSNFSATRDFDQDGDISNIDWTQVNDETGKAVIDAITSYRSMTHEEDDADYAQLEEWIQASTENGQINWSKVFAQEGFGEWWARVMMPIINESDNKEGSGTSSNTELGQLETANDALSSIQTSATGIYGLLMSYVAQMKGEKYDLTTKEGATKFFEEVLLAPGGGVQAPPDRSDYDEGEEGDKAYAQAVEKWYNTLDPAARAVFDMATGRITPEEAQRDGTTTVVDQGLDLADKIEKESAVQEANAARNAALAESASAEESYANLLGDYEEHFGFAYREATLDERLNWAFGSGETGVVPTSVEMTGKVTDSNGEERDARKGDTVQFGTTENGFRYSTQDGNITITMPWQFEDGNGQLTNSLALTSGDLTGLDPQWVTALQEGQYIPYTVLEQWIAAASPEDKATRELVLSALYGPRVTTDGEGTEKRSNGKAAFDEESEWRASIEAGANAVEEANAALEKTELALTKAVQNLLDTYVNIGLTYAEASQKIAEFLGVDNLEGPDFAWAKELLNRAYPEEADQARRDSERKTIVNAEGERYAQWLAEQRAIELAEADQARRDSERREVVDAEGERYAQWLAEQRAIELAEADQARRDSERKEVVDAEGERYAQWLAEQRAAAAAARQHGETQMGLARGAQLAGEAAGEDSAQAYKRRVEEIRAAIADQARRDSERKEVVDAEGERYAQWLAEQRAIELAEADQARRDSERKEVVDAEGEAYTRWWGSSEFPTVGSIDLESYLIRRDLYDKTGSFTNVESTNGVETWAPSDGSGYVYQYGISYPSEDEYGNPSTEQIVLFEDPTGGLGSNRALGNEDNPFFNFLQQAGVFDEGGIYEDYVSIGEDGEQYYEAADLLFERAEDFPILYDIYQDWAALSEAFGTDEIPVTISQTGGEISYTIDGEGLYGEDPIEDETTVYEAALSSLADYLNEQESETPSYDLEMLWAALPFIMEKESIIDPEDGDTSYVYDLLEALELANFDEAILIFQDILGMFPGLESYLALMVNRPDKTVTPDTEVTAPKESVPIVTEEVTLKTEEPPPPGSGEEDYWPSGGGPGPVKPEPAFFSPEDSFRLAQVFKNLPKFASLNGMPTPSTGMMPYSQQPVVEQPINETTEVTADFTEASESANDLTTSLISLFASILTTDTNLDSMSGSVSTVSSSASNASYAIGSMASRAWGAVNALKALSNAATSAASSGTTTADGGTAAVTGNVSGLALADGNSSLDRLNIGARLAGRTLVGELGPELAVYNGMYHLLGQNGAEFVNLPSDAIVFNHRQTAGIIHGQAGYRGTALAEGNADDIIKGEAFVNGHISGPALADASSTLAQLKNLRAMWQSILGMTAADLAAAGGGGGGGGGNNAKAYTDELEEWYNLSRQIANIETEINNILAERENIYDGSEYLRSLRAEQALLEKQRATQEILLEYQRLQLKRQAEHINNHAIWSQFLTVGEDGLLQYVEGNETDNGKGALSILQQLNEKSSKEQLDYITTHFGAWLNSDSARDEEGELLEDEELVQRFYEDLQDQIDQYDELYDTVHETQGRLEELTTSIENVNKAVIENQMELETDIYDILVEAWEKEIEQLEEHAELVEEANKAYVKNLKEALNAEKKLYEQDKKVEDREALQRQLALLRRSGGSASEIADLEEQLDEALQDEYFNKQEQMISNIEDANEEQIRKLEEQITLEEEALEYQKENGVLWSKVYDILAGSKESILAFMQGNSTEFFSKSALEQEKMLLDWAKKIGIYTEDQQYQNYYAEAASMWANDSIWNNEDIDDFKEYYDTLSAEQQKAAQQLFNTTYASALINGKEPKEAVQEAANTVRDTLSHKQEQDNDEKTNTGTNFGGSSITPGKPTQDSNRYRVNYTIRYEDNSTISGYGLGSTPEKARGAAEQQVKQKPTTSPSGARLTGIEYSNAIKRYATGGLVDYTGLAMVHGSKSKPEAFLNAAQTAQIKEALQATNGKKNLLEGLHSTIAELRSLIHNISTINNSTNNNITVAPGAVVIQVEQLADSYDVKALSADVMNRMVAIASKVTNRGVNRR